MVEHEAGIERITGHRLGSGHGWGSGHSSDLGINNVQELNKMLNSGHKLH